MGGVPGEYGRGTGGSGAVGDRCKSARVGAEASHQFGAGELHSMGWEGQYVWDAICIDTALTHQRIVPNAPSCIASGHHFRRYE